MAESPQMILPKGIVVNWDGVYDDIARNPTLSDEQLMRAWRIYTTTHRKLRDPTAARLESLWWRVWGSERRRLSGVTLARLYELVSNGPTFVPLRGPANRFEGPRNAHEDHGTTALVKQDRQSADDALLQPRPRRNGLQPGSYEKPHPQPILKKPRGPSSSGPRPTARFALPTSEEESTDEERPEITRNQQPHNGTASTGLESPISVEHSSKSSSRSGSPTGNGTAVKRPKKKAAVVVAANKSRRRPALPRRPSSQGTELGSENTLTLNGKSKRNSYGERRAGSRPSSLIIVNSPATSEKGTEPIQSEKAAGKRPMSVKDLQRQLREEQQRAASQAPLPEIRPTNGNTSGSARRAAAVQATHTPALPSVPTSSAPYADSQFSPPPPPPPPTTSQTPQTPTSIFAHRRLPSAKSSVSLSRIPSGAFTKPRRQSSSSSSSQRPAERSFTSPASIAPVSTTTSGRGEIGIIDPRRSPTRRPNTTSSTTTSTITAGGIGSPSMTGNATFSSAAAFSTPASFTVSATGSPNTAAAAAAAASSFMSASPPVGGNILRNGPRSPLVGMFTPTMSATPDVELARSKSQLGLVLSRENARRGEMEARSQSRKR